MTDAPDGPGIVLVTPPEIEASTFPGLLSACLDARPVACVRLSLATRDEARLGRAADALREVAHARDVPLVVDGPVASVGRFGLDGVHLADAARSLGAARKALGADAIVGAFCGASRHDGMTAAELGADYVSFGPVGPPRPDAAPADDDLFAWWSEMIEVPVIAEGGLDEAAVRRLAPVVDFFALGREVWDADDPVAALARLAGAMG